MADALCGPSNALQTFKQHTGVDRTLQQDRLISRLSPSQGFRSNLGPNVGALDPEFDAFQAGHAVPPQAFHQQHFSPPPQFSHQQHQQHPQPQFSQAPAGPDWASDFQRLALAPQHVQQRQQQQASNTASWHQDFMNPGLPSGVQSPNYAQRPFGGMGAGMGMGMGAYARPMGDMNGAPIQQQQVANGKQKVQEFDEAAFEAAFEQAQRDMMGEVETKVEDGGQQENMPAESVYDAHQSHANEPGLKYEDLLQDYEAQSLELERQNKARLLAAWQEQDVLNGTVESDAVLPQDYEAQLRELERQNKVRLLAARQEQDVLNGTAESDPVLLRIREKRPSVYTTIKFRSELDLGRADNARPYLRDLEDMESVGVLTQDASEAKWCVDALQKSIARDAPQGIRSRVENLIKSINERLMSSYPLLATGAPIRQEDIWNELRAAGYTTHDNPVLGREQQPEQQKEEHHQPKNDEDDMAETAGRLLERVADNSSEKFKNSQFLELMRRLRDREVRVEGDKMVEVSAQSSISSIPPASQPASSTAPIHQSTFVPASAPPEVDPNILDFADTDLSMPSAPDFDDPNFNAHLSPVTDGISDTDLQFNYYNANSSYHR